MAGVGGFRRAARWCLSNGARIVEILVNGEPRRVDAGCTLSALLEQLSLTGQRLAVEVNEDIVPRSQHAGHVLTAGDRVEIVHAIGGG